jgi:hypothetical protein
MICETEAALAYALDTPHRFPRIPTVEVGTATFDARLAAHYWETRLGLGAATRSARKRRRLLRVRSNLTSTDPLA